MKNTQSNTRVNTLVTTDPVENEWKGLFRSTEHWQSDLGFFADELQFFRSLIDKHFMRLIREEHRDLTKETVGKMGKVENRRHNLEQKVRRHLFHMSNLIGDPFPHDAHAYLEEHAKLEAAMADFVKDSRRLKTEIFGLARRVMDEEKTNHLLNK